MRRSTWVASGRRVAWVGRWKRSPSSVLWSRVWSEDSDTSPSPLLLVARRPCGGCELAEDKEEEVRRVLPLLLLLVG